MCSEVIQTAELLVPRFRLLIGNLAQPPQRHRQHRHADPKKERDGVDSIILDSEAVAMGDDAHLIVATPHTRDGSRHRHPRHVCDL